MKLTSKKVLDYMSHRTDEELRHCPEALSAACNDMFEDYKNSFNDNLTAKDLLKLLLFNDLVKSLHTHNYGFNTETGRAIIEQLKSRYYGYKSTD